MALRKYSLIAVLISTTALTSPALADPITLTAAVAGAAAANAGAAAAIGITGAFAAAAFNAAVGAVVATAINVVGSRALTKKPKSQAFSQDAQGRSITLRSTVESHKIIYGLAKVSGPLVFASSTGSLLHLIVALAGHEVEEIGTLYLNDQPVEEDASGSVLSAPYSYPSEGVVTTQVAIASATVQSDRFAAPKLTATCAAPHGVAPGTYVTITGANNYRFNGRFKVEATPSATVMVCDASQFLGYAASPITSTGGAITRSRTVTSTSSYVRVRRHLGSPDQLADELLVAEVPEWTDAHRLRGIAYAYIRLQYHADAFPTGIPNVSFLVKGKKVYVPALGSNVWTSNAALCIRDYLTARDGSAVDEPYGFGCTDAEIDDDYTTASAGISSEPVPISDGTVQARYTCDGVLDTASAPMDNLQSLVTSLAGAVTYVQGKFRIHAAAYDAPSGAITDDMLAGSVQTTLRTPRKDLFNAVKGSIVDRDRLWQPTDFPAVTNPLYEAQDGGERIYRDVELPFTINPVAAQRLGKILLEKGRQGITQTLPVNFHALKYSVYDVITRTDARHGWVDKPFRIMNFAMAVPGPLTMTIREESPDSYDWDMGMATATDRAPDTNLPSSASVSPPGALTASESKYVTRAGDGVKAMIALSWVPSQDVFLRDYQPEYRLHGEGVWRPLARTAGTRADVEDIAPGAYDFRVKATNMLGVSSAYSTATLTAAGLLDPPLEPQNLTIGTIGGFAVLGWDEYEGNVNLDVRIGGRIIFRHSPDLTAGWAQSTTIGNPAPGSASSGNLPLKPGIYLAKAVDASGIESAGFASARTEQATALAYASVTSLTEDPAFSGAKMNCVVDVLDNLRLTGGGTFSDIPLLSAVPLVSNYGGIAQSGTYSFSGAIDLGSVMPVRLTSHIKAAIINQLDTIRSRTAPMSTWKSFTGADAAEGDARVYVRTTPDDPAGTPAWGEWRRLDSGEFSCRAIDAELRLESYDPAYNVLVSELSINVDEVA